MDKNESGFIIYLQDNPNLQFYFDKSVGKSHTTIPQNVNISKVTLNNFGKYPYIYNVGNMNYRTFDLTGVFLAIYDDDNNKVLTANEHAKQFESLVNLRKPFIIENSKREKYLCDIQIKTVTAPMLYYEDDMEYVTIDISCIEIGSV